MADRILPDFPVGVSLNISDSILLMLPFLGQEVNHG
jgi:hypothetical protein